MEGKVCLATPADPFMYLVHVSFCQDTCNDMLLSQTVKVKEELTFCTCLPLHAHASLSVACPGPTIMIDGQPVTPHFIHHVANRSDSVGCCMVSAHKLLVMLCSRVAFVTLSWLC